MALRSRLAQIKLGFLKLAGSPTLDDSTVTGYIRDAITLDLPELIARRFRPLVQSWSFRSADEAQFRKLDNCTLDDRLKATDTALTATCETVAMDLEGGQPGLLIVSADTVTAGGTVGFDICLDAKADDVEAGAWLHADEGVTLALGTELVVDIYPAERLVLQFTVTGSAAFKSAQVWMEFLGDEAKATDEMVIALLAAAYWYDGLQRKYAANAADQLSDRYRLIAKDMRARAQGMLSATDVKAGSNVGTVIGPAAPRNRNYEKFRDRIG